MSLKVAIYLRYLHEGEKKIEEMKTCILVKMKICENIQHLTSADMLR